MLFILQKLAYLLKKTAKMFKFYLLNIYLCFYQKKKHNPILFCVSSRVSSWDMAKESNVKNEITKYSPLKNFNEKNIIILVRVFKA
ncbi:unnamed protein product [Blepharisma stoltei]|uniref:Uncharacterized protein n=1 Tax=Blepharisma stoltei TaxID=1481888 RepID=A0AAU9JW43_9CILI|nr:unnamed protein product [Blepharisma stoltei]